VNDERALTDGEKASMAQVRDMGRQFYDFCEFMGPSREMSLAMTKIEEAVMWARKGIAR